MSLARGECGSPFSDLRLLPPRALSGMLCSCLVHWHRRGMRASRKEPFSFSSKRGKGGWQLFGFSAKTLVVGASVERQTSCMYIISICSHLPRETFNRVPLMKENFSILFLLMMLFFVLVDVCWSQYSPLTLDCKFLLFFPC